MKHPAVNPYLPLTEYIPDGEPRLFNGRVYIYGSHDRARGEYFCEQDYVTWSAPEEDLSDWRYEGVIYRRGQDPADPDGKLEMFAPDVVQGPDGRYYLFYCLKMLPRISVAVSDRPEGPFVFYGYVHRKDSRPLAEYMPYDPAVLVDDDGQIYLYYGFSSEFLAWQYGVEISPGSMMVRLEADMLTMQTEPETMIPWHGLAAGTEFEAHPFFEAPSIRKIGGRYYLVYSSRQFHELCYAVSDRPDGGYRYGGVIIDNGDLGMNGRDVPACATGNNHGGLLVIAGKTYIFYHRHTNGTSFSRQGCADPVTILPDGSIPQAEITSCGLNGAPLPAEGTWPAAVCCWLGGTFASEFLTHRTRYDAGRISCITQDGSGGGARVYIRNIMDGTVIGYKYFHADRPRSPELSVRGECRGVLKMYTGSPDALPCSEIPLALSGGTWQPVRLGALPAGTFGLYFRFKGEGSFDFVSFSFHDS